MSFSFDSDWLVFHPQSAQDCGWSANTEGHYKVQTNIHSNVVNVHLQALLWVHKFIQLYVTTLSFDRYASVKLKGCVTVMVK